MKRKLIIALILFCCSRLTHAQPNHADTLKQRLRSATDDKVKVDLLSELARFYMFYYPDTSQYYGMEGLQQARKLNYKAGEASCLLSLCISLTFLGNYTSGLDYGLQASPLLSDLHDTTLLIWNNIQILTCYRQMEDYDQALIYGYNALRLVNHFHADSNQISVGLGAVGSVYEKKNQLDSALYYQQKAFAIDTSWSQIFQYLGQTYTKKGNVSRALDYYKRGLNNASKENNSVAFIDISNDISKTFELTGKTDSAIFYADKSIQHADLKINPEGLLESSTQLSRLYEIRGNLDSAIKYLKTAHILKDSLYSRKKTREAQNLAFKEKLHQQDLVVQHQKDENSIRIAVLLAVIFIFLVIAFFLWRNNQHKQKAKDKIEQAYAELKATQAQLIQSEKMASLGELTAGIAHEIQNPLNFVNNFSEVNMEMLQELKGEHLKPITSRNGQLETDIIDGIIANEEKINHHGKRADVIVKGMLQHSRQASGAKELTDINLLANNYLKLAYQVMKAKDNSLDIAIVEDFDKTIGKINIIPQDIGRVLLNLGNNAFYALNEKIKQHPVGFEPTVSVTTKKFGDYVEIRISDNGNGIPESIKDKIFQPFFTTKPTGQGTGLGLSLSYDIVKAHQGEIKVISKEGIGTDFIIQLPIT